MLAHVICKKQYRTNGVRISSVFAGEAKDTKAVTTFGVYFLYWAGIPAKRIAVFSGTMECYTSAPPGKGVIEETKQNPFRSDDIVRVGQLMTPPGDEPVWRI